jgi:iron complex outermembrane receptor protein
MKGLALARVQYDVAFYDTWVRDELISFDIGSGRTAFRNAGRTRRRGAEAAASTDVGPLSFSAAYTYSRFRFKDFVTGTTQQAGHAIPGIPERQFQTAVTARVQRAFAVAEWQAKSAVYVNDANATAAPGYAVVNARLGATAAFGRPWLMPVVGIQNAFDRKYVGSVAVNAARNVAGTPGSEKFYEPGSGRTWFVGLSAGSAHW